MRKAHLLFLFTMLTLALPHYAWSYGAMGHRVIGELAQESLTSEAAAEVSRLLEGQSLADASTWADERRSSNNNPEFWGYDYASSWHFINTEPGQSYSESTKNSAGDAWVALQTFIAILQNQSIPAGPVRDGLTLYFGDLDNPLLQTTLKQFALRFLVHLVGDLHQPLHVAFAEDRGGNAINVTWFGRSSNLHAVWDSRLLTVLADNEAGLITRLKQRMNTMDGLHGNPAPYAWLAESAKIRDQVYQAHNKHPEYDSAYVEAFGGVAEEQLIKASVRLAGLLNRLFRQR